MRTIGITVKKTALDGNTFPYFVRDNYHQQHFWMVTGPSYVKSKDGKKLVINKNLVNATFLGNTSYKPFQYQTEIDLIGYKRVEASTVILRFE